MQSTVHINVSAIDYDATSRALATVLDRMQDMIHGKEEFSHYRFRSCIWVAFLCGYRKCSGS